MKCQPLSRKAEKKCRMEEEEGDDRKKNPGESNGAFG